MGDWIVNFLEIRTYVELGILLVLPLLVYFSLRKFIKQPFYYVTMAIFHLATVVFWLFRFDVLVYVALSVAVIFTIIATVLNIGAFRPYLLNSSPNVLISKKQKNIRTGRLYDRDEVISKVNEAVQICVKINKNKAYDRVNKKNEAGIGLLICFERNDKLDSIIDSGYEILNADVSPRLLTTIFFEGTQLHDGAVIIRDGKIYCASAFLPPTTDPVVGKFGARHRAAKGVTQKSDCVSLLVSEETGEITVFDDGDGIVIEPEDFERKFKDIFDNPARIARQKENN